MCQNPDRQNFRQFSADQVEDKGKNYKLFRYPTLTVYCSVVRTLRNVEVFRENHHYLMVSKRLVVLGRFAQSRVLWRGLLSCSSNSVIWFTWWMLQYWGLSSLSEYSAVKVFLIVLMFNVLNEIKDLLKTIWFIYFCPAGKVSLRCYDVLLWSYFSLKSCESIYFWWLIFDNDEFITLITTSNCFLSCIFSDKNVQYFPLLPFIQYVVLYFQVEEMKVEEWNWILLFNERQEDHQTLTKHPKKSLNKMALTRKSITTSELLEVFDDLDFGFATAPQHHHLQPWSQDDKDDLLRNIVNKGIIYWLKLTITSYNILLVCNDKNWILTYFQIFSAKDVKGFFVSKYFEFHAFVRIY